MGSARAIRFVAGCLTLTCALTILLAQDAPRRRRNAIIFVADGLRAGSVNATDTPAFWYVRTEGVNFANSHSIYPALTMPNASAIATGHYPGDTGQFGNMMFINYPLFMRGNFGKPPGTNTPDVEEAMILGDISDFYAGNYLREPTLLAYARSYGYNTAAVGKTGPAALQDLTELNPRRGVFRVPTTIIIDGDTGTESGVPLAPQTVSLLKAAGLPPAPPDRNQPEGSNAEPGAREANVVHQQWLIDAFTRAILPRFVKGEEPFVALFWSGDPDQTQHAQGDSFNSLVPGINGPTSLSGVRNADRNLRQILDFLNANPEVRENTDLFVTADHGFSTVSLREIDATGRPTTSYSTTFTYRDDSGRQEVNSGFLPKGFLAIDLAHALGLPLYDPDSQVAGPGGTRRYAPVDPSAARPDERVRQRPREGNGLVGGTGRLGRPTDAVAVVTTHGAIYLPRNDRLVAQQIVSFLVTQDYVGGLFVNDRMGQIDGALPMSLVNWVGPTTLPRPSIVVSFKSFSIDPKNPLMTTVNVGGTRQHGQGSHGPLTRANTFNNMAAIGPDFRRRFVDQAPVSNADIVPTLANVLGMKLPRNGSLTGRIIAEALAAQGRQADVQSQRRTARSQSAAGGLATVLMYQQMGNQRYFDEACFTQQPTCP